MEEKLDNNRHIFYYTNAGLQLCAIFAFHHFGVIWPFYIIMAMLSIVILLQTLGGAITFSGIGLKGDVKVENSGGINIIISILYLLSSYNIYLIGFVGFAWIAATHSVIHLLTNIFGASKNDSSSVHSDEK